MRAAAARCSAPRAVVKRAAVAAGEDGEGDAGDDGEDDDADIDTAGEGGTTDDDGGRAGHSTEEDLDVSTSSAGAAAAAAADADTDGDDAPVGQLTQAEIRRRIAARRGGARAAGGRKGAAAKATDASSDSDAARGVGGRVRRESDRVGGKITKRDMDRLDYAKKVGGLGAGGRAGTWMGRRMHSWMGSGDELEPPGAASASALGQPALSIPLLRLAPPLVPRCTATRLAPRHWK